MPKIESSTIRRLYATGTDFCQIFYEQTDRLYRLSFLLTADREKAEQCFVCGLEDSVKGNPVFKEWAHSWVRRMIIQNAVRLVSPRPLEEESRSGFRLSNESLAAEPDEIAAVLELEPFERFVFVMSVLERYSDQECSLLLGCARSAVSEARLRALRQIGCAMELTLGRQ